MRAKIWRHRHLRESNARYCHSGGTIWGAFGIEANRAVRDAEGLYGSAEYTKNCFQIYLLIALFASLFRSVELDLNPDMTARPSEAKNSSIIVLWGRPSDAGTKHTHNHTLPSPLHLTPIDHILSRSTPPAPAPQTPALTPQPPTLKWNQT